MAPIVKTLPSYIKGNQHTLEIFRDFNFLGQDKLLFTVDITSLFSVIYHSVAKHFFWSTSVVEVDDAFRNNTVHVEPFMSRYTSVHHTTWQLFACFSAKFYHFITVIRYLSMNKEYEERFRNNLPQTHVI